MDCLDEETILAFCRGDLAADVRARAQEHISECDECRVLVSAVARSSFSELRATPSQPPPDSDPDARMPGPMLRQSAAQGQRIDPAMAPTTPIGGGAFPPGTAIAPVKPGEILAGKYEVERVLGAGGMGIVVAARHTQLEQRVALKFLLPQACEVPGAVTRFLREGKAAARITSEHVARVIDTGVLGSDTHGGVGGAPYLVMEYLEGSDLGALVERHGRFTADEAIDYVLQACEAIVEAHELGIVHRDLKPANLFLSRRADGSPLVKVLDFGISKVAGTGSRSQLTSASVLMGSPRYMSPEQMLSAKDVDARTDVWALGVILYELVCAKPVWQADTVQGLCALIASAPAPPLRALAPDAPALLEEVVARCLTKSLDERMASVADLALALEPIAPASARTSIERILRVGRREHRPSAGPRSGAAKVSPSLGGSGAIAGASPAASAADATTAGRQGGSSSGRVGLVLALAVGALLVVGIAVNAMRTSSEPRRTGEGVREPALTALQPALASSTVPTATESAPAPPIVGSTTGAPTAPAPVGAASLARRLVRAPSPSAVSSPAAPATTSTAESKPAEPRLPVASSALPAASSRALTDRK